MALGFIHFAIALPGEGDMVAVACAGDLPGDAAAGEFAGATRGEFDVGGLHRAGIVLNVVGHLNDPPAARSAVPVA